MVTSSAVWRLFVGEDIALLSLAVAPLVSRLLLAGATVLFVLVWKWEVSGIFWAFVAARSCRRTPLPGEAG